MAEAAALALAGTILRRLAINEVFFLSDYQQLVIYINFASIEDIPRWEAQIYTQIFRNMVPGRGYKVYKISRTLNISAHVLAQRARNPVDIATGVFVNCHCATHISSCPIRNAL
jgi:hypothetical protein